MNIKSTKINIGIYEITTSNKTFMVERVETGEWMLCEMIKGEKEYYNHFVTKSDAIQAIKDNE